MAIYIQEDLVGDSKKRREVGEDRGRDSVLVVVDAQTSSNTATVRAGLLYFPIR